MLEIVFRSFTCFLTHKRSIPFLYDVELTFSHPLALMQRVCAIFPYSVKDVNRNSVQSNCHQSRCSQAPPPPKDLHVTIIRNRFGTLFEHKFRNTISGPASRHEQVMWPLEIRQSNMDRVAHGHHIQFNAQPQSESGHPQQGCVTELPRAPTGQKLLSPTR